MARMLKLGLTILPLILLLGLQSCFLRNTAREKPGEPFVSIFYASAGLPNGRSTVYHIFRNGRVACDGDRKAEFPAGTVDTETLARLIDAAGDLRKVRHGICVCPSWGCGSITLRYLGEGSANLECLADDSRASLKQLQAYVMRFPSSLPFPPPEPREQTILRELSRLPLSLPEYDSLQAQFQSAAISSTTTARSALARLLGHHVTSCAQKYFTAPPHFNREGRSSFTIRQLTAEKFYFSGGPELDMASPDWLANGSIRFPFKDRSNRINEVRMTSDGRLALLYEYFDGGIKIDRVCLEDASLTHPSPTRP